MDEYSVSAFPTNKCEALAMLYTQNQDLTGKTPEEILDIYDNAYEQIARRIQAIADSKKDWL